MARTKARRRGRARGCTRGCTRGRSRGGKNTSTTNTIDIVAYSSPLNRRLANIQAGLPDGEKTSRNDRKINTYIEHTRSVRSDSLWDWLCNTMDSVDEAIALSIDSSSGKKLPEPIYRRVIKITNSQGRNKKTPGDNLEADSEADSGDEGK